MLWVGLPAGFALVYSCENRGMFQKILVAIDKSIFGDYVFDRSLALAESLKADLMVLHVLSADEEGSPQVPVSSSMTYYPMLVSTTFEVYQQQWQRYEAEGLEFLKSRADKAIAAGIKTEFSQAAGHPGRIICDLARTWSASLIVVGRRGRNGLSEFFMGSVSNYVLHHAPCEVLVVHTPPTLG